MDLKGLRARITRAGAAVPRNAPAANMPTAAAWVDLAISEAAVCSALESWAEKRPGFEPTPEPTVWHQPDDADRRMAAQCPQLAALAEAHLIHAPGVLDARLSRLCEQYENAREPDEAIDRALADSGAQLTALIASGADVPSWCADRVAILQRRNCSETAPKPHNERIRS